MASFEVMVNFPQLWWERIMSFLTCILTVVYYGSLIPIIPLIVTGYATTSKADFIAVLFVALWIFIPIAARLILHGMFKLYEMIVPN